MKPMPIIFSIIFINILYPYSNFLFLIFISLSLTRYQYSKITNEEDEKRVYSDEVDSLMNFIRDNGLVPLELMTDV